MQGKAGVVFWEDAQSLRKEGIPDKCPVMKSIGIITKRKNMVIVTSLITPDGDMEDGINTIIPIKMVKQIKWLYFRQKT